MVGKLFEAIEWWFAVLSYLLGKLAFDAWWSLSSDSRNREDASRYRGTR